MEQGQIIYIRNDAGKLRICLDNKLTLMDVMRGAGKDKLPQFTNPRWEFHRGRWDEIIMTLTDETGTPPPHDIYIAFYDFGNVEVWKAHFDSGEEPESIYETVQC